MAVELHESLYARAQFIQCGENSCSPQVTLVRVALSDILVGSVSRGRCLYTLGYTK
jgi:hypothetical protein